MIGLVSVGLYASDRATKVGELQGSVDTLTTSLQQAQESLQRAQDSAAVTNSVVVENTTSKSISASKTQLNIAKVDALVTKRTYNEIDDAGLDAALSNSMWDAYCSAASADDSDCTSRQLAAPLQGGETKPDGQAKPR